MTDRALDRHLTLWAAQNALSNERADAIRRAILASPPVMADSLPSAWWRQFSDALETTLRKSTLNPQFLTFSTQRSPVSRLLASVAANY